MSKKPSHLQILCKFIETRAEKEKQKKERFISDEHEDEGDDGMRSTAAESSGRHDRYCVAGGHAGGAGSSTGVHTAAAD